MILLDLTMPDMGGIELATELRALAPGVPIVFMSGHSERDSLARVDGPFLQKPFRIAVMRRVLTSVLR